MPAIIFDFDGVLIDSEPVHEAAIRAAVRELGMDFSPADYRTRYLGLDDRDIYAGVAAANARALSPADLHALSERKWVHARRAFENGAAAPYPAAVALLKASAVACPVALCSGAKRQEIDLVLGILGIGGLLRVIVSADEVAKSKPDPASYRLATARLGLAPSACVAIEDTDKGIRSALDAGVRAVGVCHSMTTRELAAAHLVVPSAADLSVHKLLAMVDG